MKNILITGSTRGIGKQIGIDLLKKGYFVIFNGNSVESCTKLTEELAMNKLENYHIIRANMADANDIKGVSNYILESNKLLDNVIFNMGITDRTEFGKITEEGWNKVFNTNLNYPFFMLQDIKSRITRYGKIIFIGSISGSFPDSVSIAYGVSKGSLEILVKYLAKELAPGKINVNCVAPGYTDTSWHDSKSPEQIKRIKNKILLKRFATTKEISQVCQMLLENDYITGQTIHVDGGIGLI